MNERRKFLEEFLDETHLDHINSVIYIYMKETPYGFTHTSVNSTVVNCMKNI